MIICGLPRTRVPTLDGRIVGGNDADISDFPYQLVLQYLDQHFCGAGILSSTWAVTAAHCVDDGIVTGISVRAGSTRRSSGGQTVDVSRIILHPEYDWWTLDYDIALLELVEPISVANASAIVLPEADAPIAVGSIATVTGWGVLEPNAGTTPEILQVVEVPVVSQEDCSEAYTSYPVTDRMFCAGLLGVGGKDACQGDSGGPVIVDGVLTGLVSWGISCAEALYPGVYTNVRALRSWINEETGL
ncbi:hypothetical protein NQ314_005771 [Rhamnusium bicolor]|uniref:Peptidase S1 domain-containing protein n=1 Tax=Rhamnusium bicolor TaxID=1586634 RepID=A0AAV8ZCZ7_9CUCU|nr:hypothetical protein NQ314_005771 [Rhamnusium bicolor]